MTETIIPAFRDAPAEATVVGRLLSGYSELELEMMQCVHLVSGDLDGAVRALYGKRGERKRVLNARKQSAPVFGSIGLAPQHRETFGDMDWCRAIRNQYAHCAWYYTSREGLCFTDLEKLARDPAPIAALTRLKYPVNEILLSEQERFFKHVQKRLWWLQQEYQILTGKAGRRPTRLWSWPLAMARPREHN
jgi:hypothetical protein